MTAENIVKNYGVTREEMDRMAYESNMKAAKAQKEGKLAPSIIPVTVVDKDGNEKVVTEDEGIRSNNNNGRHLQVLNLASSQLKKAVQLQLLLLHRHLMLQHSLY